MFQRSLIESQVDTFNIATGFKESEYVSDCFQGVLHSSVFSLALYSQH